MSKIITYRLITDAGKLPEIDTIFKKGDKVKVVITLVSKR